MPRKRIVQLITVIIASIFLGGLFWKYSDKVSNLHWDLNYFYLFLSVLAFSSLFFIASFAWMLILHKLDINISFRKSMEIWVASLIGKYIPGKVWVVLGRVYIGQKLGISKMKMSLATILEIILMHSSGIIIFFFSLVFWKQIAFSYQVWTYLVIFCVLSLIVMHPFVLQRVVKFFLRILKKKEVSVDIAYKDVLSLLAFYLFFWFCTGVSIYFLTKSFYPVTIADLPVISGIWAISTILGVVAFIVPGGIGVREGVAVFLLQSLIPVHLALLVAISARILLTILELVFVWILVKFDVSLSKYYDEAKFSQAQ